MLTGATVSGSGPGTLARPASSMSTADSTIPKSGSPSTPSSMRFGQIASTPPRRARSGGHSFANIVRSALVSSRCSSVSANCMSPAARKVEDTFGDQVALDLVGTGVDRTGEREQEPVEPRGVDRGRVVEQPQRDLVRPQIQL